MQPTSDEHDLGLLLVGNPEPIHIGAHLLKAARELGMAATLTSSHNAFRASPLRQKLNWWLRDRRPARLTEFGRQVVDLCRTLRPAWLVTTGLAPVHKEALDQIGKCNVVRLNYLTDDPWNPSQRSRWFLKALPGYDCVFSPRRSNLHDLARAGCGWTVYLPFAYDPTLHFPEPANRLAECLESDVIFVGGADRDRLPYVKALISAGLNVALYGGYWDRFATTRPFARGHADPATLRKATAAARVVLCLVRQANRDGHVMRSFEAAATGACMLVEDTPEHREIFGPDHASVVYFLGIEQMISRLRDLLLDPAERSRLAGAVRTRIVGGANTYRDRLTTMLETTGSLACR
jgi:spore maturation protein CgeB